MTIITLSLHENDRFHWFCVKSVEIRSFFWSECGKIRTRKKSVFGHFSRTEVFKKIVNDYSKFNTVRLSRHEQVCLKKLIHDVINLLYYGH